MHLRQIQCLVLATLCGVLSAAASTAESERRDPLDRWIPSLGFSFGVLAQPSGGAVESGDFIGPPVSDGGCETRPGSNPGVREPGPCKEPIESDALLTPNLSANDTTTAALMSLSLEVMAPALRSLPGRPRLFGHVDSSFAFAFERKLAGEGRPGPMQVPPPPASAPGSVSNVTEDTISGQGNRSISKLSTPVFNAGAGLSFDLGVRGRRIRIKPSFEYLRQEIEFIGQANRAIQIRGSNDERPGSIDDYRLVSLSASKSRVHHGIGGGLELEADTQRLGPFVISVFAGGRIYHVLGDIDETLRSDRNQVGPSVDGEAVTWHFEPENILWQGGVGVRFRYLPE